MTVSGQLASQAIRPSTLPQTIEDLILEQSFAKER